MDTFFTRLAKNSSEALAHFDGKGRCTFSNVSFSKLIGKRVGTDCHCADVFEEYPVLQGKILQASKGFNKKTGEGEFLCVETLADGERELSCRVITLEQESGFILEIKDVSELTLLRRLVSADRMSRRQEELLMRRRRELFFGLLDDLPTFVYLQRRDYTVAFANKKVKKLYGEPEGRLCYEVFAGRTSPCPVCPTFEVFDTGQPTEWEFIDNNGRTFLIYDYPFEDETGEPLVMEMGVDITDLKNVEKELFKAQKLRAIGVLAGGIAHDLNNNLVPIIFNIEYARSKIANSAIVEPLDDALQAAQRAAKLVAQVLEYSRQQDVSTEPIRLRPLVRGCIRELELNIGPRVKLQLDVVGGGDCVCANTTQIEQIVHNLVRNAEHAMPGGGDIFVSLTSEVLGEKRSMVTGDLPPGNYVVLEVQDTGIGIRKEDRERIFEPFFTQRKSSGGTGMGLAVVHSIVAGSGGGIDVQSTPGLGSVFTIYLPQVEEVVGMLSGELCFHEGENIQILLVDDDAGALSAMSRVLVEAGFQVDTAVCGQEGLSLFQLNPEKYNLVLVDQSMPEMTGLEMATKIFEFRKDTKVVICTGHIEPALEVQARQTGIAGFARKPMMSKNLIETVKRHCRY